MKNVRIYNASSIADDLSDFNANCTDEFLLIGKELYNCHLEKYGRHVPDFEFKSGVFEASCHNEGCQIDHANDGPVEVITMAHIIPYHITDDTLEYIAWNGTNIVMNKLDHKNDQWSRDRNHLQRGNNIRNVRSYNESIIYDDDDGVHQIGCDESLSCDNATQVVAFQLIADTVYLFDENNVLCSAELGGDDKCALLRRTDLGKVEDAAELQPNDLYIENNSPLRAVLIDGEKTFKFEGDVITPVNSTFIQFAERIVAMNSEGPIDGPHYLKALDVTSNLVEDILQRDSIFIGLNKTDSYAEVHVNGDTIGYLTNDQSQNAKAYIAEETVTDASTQALGECKEELTKVLREKNAVQLSLHTCAKRQTEIREELEIEKAVLSDLVDERNIAILDGQDTLDAVEKKLESARSELENVKRENERLSTMISELEAKSISYERNINTYQGQVEDFRLFRSQNKCLDPIIFWSGYAVAVLIVFFTCIFHVILHNRRKRRRKSAKDKPTQIMERIQIDTHSDPHSCSPSPIRQSSSPSSRVSTRASPTPHQSEVIKLIPNEHTNEQ